MSLTCAASGAALSWAAARYAAAVSSAWARCSLSVLGLLAAAVLREAFFFQDTVPPIRMGYGS
ncbi:putative benzoate transport protein [Cutibacterium acnes HL099PA1]|nr:putative benzoate transport protein [Cutibacterium acnes HL099PA1]